MFARVSTFEGIKAISPKMMRDMGEALKPLLQGMTGWKSSLNLLDRDNGKLLSINLFDNEENMNAAEEEFEAMPEKLGGMRDEMGGERTKIERYEVVGEGIND